MEAAIRLTPEADAGGLVSAPELRCRVCELEAENVRLRLLVGELLVANQRLREQAAVVRSDAQKLRMNAG